MKIHGRLWLLLAFSPSSWASCAFSQDAGALKAMKTYTIPLSGSISVPADIPIGREIYRLKVSLANQGKVKVDCTSAGQFYSGFSYLTTPSPVSTYSSTVYETGVPGIGVKFTRGNNAADFPSTTTSTVCISVKSCLYLDGWPAESRFTLVKTASTVTPGTVLASKLPTAIYAYGQNGNMVNIYKISLTGSLQVTAPTCNITPVSQSMTVNMGKHLNTDFTGKGSATGWKKASIQLINCGQFFGNTRPGYFSGTLDGDSYTPIALLSNFLTVTLTPRNGTASTTDAANGIMKIDEYASKATGVGIQLSSTESTSGLINLTSGISQNLPKTGTSTVTIPLYARYIQTENSVTAGIADGRLEYIISHN